MQQARSKVNLSGQDMQCALSVHSVEGCGGMHASRNFWNFRRSEIGSGAFGTFLIRCKYRVLYIMYISYFSYSNFP